jgi:hypothetical protein
MTYKNLYITFFFLLFLIVGVRMSSFWNDHKQPEDQVFLTLNRALMAEMERPNKWGYKFTPISYPTVSSNELTHSFRISAFTTNKKYSSVEEAEDIFFEICSDVLHKLNSVRVIRPFLAEFPITLNSVVFSLKFWDGEENYYSKPYFASVYLDREKTLNFSQGIGDNLKYIVKKQACELNRAKKLYEFPMNRDIGKTQSRVDIPVYEVPSNNQTITKQTLSFSQSFCLKNQLHHVTSSIGYSFKDTRPFEIALRGNQQLKLDEARTLIATCSKEFLAFIRSKKEQVEYVKRRKTWPNESFYGDFPEPNHFAIRISFWDEYVNRVPEPYIAEIRVAGESFKYYTADEGQRLVLVYEESWDDAMKFLEQ